MTSMQLLLPRQQPHLLLELHMDDNAEIQAWTSALRSAIAATGNAKSGSVPVNPAGGTNGGAPPRDEQMEAGRGVVMLMAGW